MATEENTIGFKVDKSVIDDFVSCKRKSFSVDIDEDTYKDLLGSVSSSVSGAGPSDSLDMQI
ncbi:MAG: hypothetical protein SOU95_04205 [Candidatus Cryptobacteroides sp.]|nr:hypothetical protein [Bacteroidales bacterium]MDD7132835.1 hypothetical protein [Bacteroidales bacterium]MDY2773703.1 hypothetical protein [Candidatus Cryptobacteroides sp.]